MGDNTRAGWGTLIVTAALAASTHAQTFQEDAIFFDADAVSDGSGTQGSPYKLVSSLEAALADDGYVYARGTIEGEGLTIDHDGVSLLPWGADKLNFDGGVLLTDDEVTWTPHGTHTNTYSGDADPSAAPIRVMRSTWAAPTETDGSDIPEADLTAAASHADCNSTTHSWFWDGSDLWINVGADPDGVGYDIVYTVAGNAVTLTGVSDARVDIGYVYRWSEFSGSSGYALRVLNCTNVQASADKVVEAGWHAGGSVGHSNYCTITIGESWGTHYSSNNNGGLLVTANTGTPTSNITGNRMYLGVVVNYRTLDVSGTALDTGGRRSLFQVHGDGASKSVEDTLSGPATSLGYDRVSVYNYDGEVDDVVVLAGQPTEIPEPLTPDRWVTYNHRAERVDVYGESFVMPVANSALRNSWCEGGDSKVADSGGGSDGGTSDARHSILLEACSITYYGTSGVGQYHEFSSDYLDLYLRGVNIYNNNSNGGNVSPFLTLNPTAAGRNTVTGWGVVFSRENAGSFLEDESGTTVAAADLSFTASLFNNVQANRYCNGAATGAASRTDWQAGPAPLSLANVYDTDPGYNAPATGDLEGGSGSYLLGNLYGAHIEVRPYAGLNDGLFGRFYGAYQYGSAAARLWSRPRPGREWR